MHHLNLIAVAPSPVIHPHKVSHHPMLETILEEAGPEIEVVAKVKAVYLLPIILSFLTYVFMSRLYVVRSPFEQSSPHPLARNDTFDLL
ncbi:hypothetical protein SASPL_124190 [Salvia splendens]|uniref:Uncharacterized protein n=1 Tax=Salvia splendens TaxID=180675 RepID=A0A8X8XQ15_SALSN|nr:hypothetical protein SASPL_124190 [Salvia splendens]